MKTACTKPRLEIFSTTPQSKDIDPPLYVQRVAEVARWSEEAGCKGILVYTDNGLVDPWLVSEIIIQNTKALCPLVAVQPVYMHPYAVAKMVASFGFLHKRRIYLNMVAGGFRNDLSALHDTTPHDKRYARLIEYTLIIKALLNGSSPVSFQGQFYQVDRLTMIPALPAELIPGIFISGSSEAGLAAARELGATAVKYPQPVSEYRHAPADRAGDSGIRLGIIARGSEEEAWHIAYERFPEDRKGELTHQLAMKVSDSLWHKQLSLLAEESKSSSGPYWLHPFENYKTFCPYLVGNYERVAGELASYINVGYKTFILDIPPDHEELQHIAVAFEQASRMAVA